MLTSRSDIVPSPVPLLRASEEPNAARAARAGQLVRVTRGIYASADDWATLAPWDRYLARVHAVADAHPDAVLVLESGCAVRGLPVFGEPPDIHLLVPTPGKSRRLERVRVHSADRMPVHESIGGMRVATPAELAVGVAHARHRAVGLAVADAVLRRHPETSADVLAAISADRPSSRGARAARWVIARADAERETPLESVSAAAMEWLGVPTPDLQRWFPGSAPEEDARVDFWWDRWRIAGESDGEVKYSGVFGDARAALRARNARDASLRERGVQATAHWSWSDVGAPARLRALLVAAGLPLIHPAQDVPLRTLAAALRGAARRG